MTKAIDLQVFSTTLPISFKNSKFYSYQWQILTATIANYMKIYLNLLIYVVILFENNLKQTPMPSPTKWYSYS
jgi:hypothetical protein